jgi:hypothetical protein
MYHFISLKLSHLMVSNDRSGSIFYFNAAFHARCWILYDRIIIMLGKNVCNVTMQIVIRILLP